MYMCIPIVNVKKGDIMCIFNNSIFSTCKMLGTVIGAIG